MILHYPIEYLGLKTAVMSFVQVMSHSGGSVGSDRTPFYGIKLPMEVKKMVQLSKTMEHSTLKAVLKGIDIIIERVAGDLLCVCSGG